MPFYEYQCRACQHHFEVMQKMSDKALLTCPACQKPDLVKWVSSPGFQLKGTGWYVSDFKNKEKKPENKDNKIEKNEKTNTTETKKSETKKDSSTDSTTSS